jgi:hypothetical protein
MVGLRSLGFKVWSDDIGSQGIGGALMALTDTIVPSSN